MKNTYFYTVSVFDYDGHTELMYYSNEKYNHHEFQIIVQDCFDEVIKRYSEEEGYDNNEPCHVDTDDVIRSPAFHNSMRKRGFNLVTTTSSVSMEETNVFSKEFGSKILRERYSHLTLGKCKECYREYEDYKKECPVLNKRRV